MSESATLFRLPNKNDRLGKLRIVDTIAVGGMAIVYKVYHEELEVIRAIKLIKPGCSEESEDRMQTEARISAHLHHPGIVHLYNVALWENEIPYIEMEYVDGASLRQHLLDKGKMSFTIAASIISVLCKALEYVQNQRITLYGKEYLGLVHRDIKPANILISKQGEIKLADFGLALPGSESLHTTGSTVMGTAPYLAPEQINAQKVDPRTDIYALGTVFFEMVTGEKAFPQKHMTELIQAKLKGKLKNLYDQRYNLPPTIVDIIMRCIAVEKAKRFANAGALGDALDAELKKYTEHLPATIIGNYVEFGEKPPIHFSLKGWGKDSNFNVLALSVGAFVVIAVAMTLMLWKFNSQSDRDVAKMPGKPPAHEEAAIPTTPKKAELSAHSGGKTQGPSATMAPEQTTRRPTAPVNKSTAKKPGARSMTKHRPAPAKVNHLKAGATALANGSTSAALQHFKTVLNESGDAAMRHRARIYLLETYLTRREYRKARDFGTANPVKDGQYYILMGKVHLAMKHYTSARGMFEKAQSTPSSVNANVSPDARHLYAQTCEAEYLRKPNLENRRQARDAWATFVQQVCGESSGAERCVAARKKAQSYN
ncbi:MAG: protein kinase [Chitinivibrionales bacterium]|nr:protein kinase [Chitinivibrionales bacterium]